jgi:hypothetical protein
MSIFFKDFDELENELTDMGAVDFMNRVLLMDYFVEFSKGFTNTIAGTLFEYFLAGLFNGEVVGQRKEVTDFIVGKKKYSAKFVAEKISITQALSKFKDEEGDTITYIVAKKYKSYKAKKRPKRRAKGEYKFGVEEIHDVDLYTFNIKYLNGDFYVNDSDEKSNLVTISQKSSYASDNENEDKEDKDARLVSMDRILSQLEPFSQIRIMSTDKDTIKAYRETLEEKLKGSRDKLIKQKKNILEMVQDIFDNIKEGESSARKYVSDGKKENGVNAMKKLTKSQISMRLLNKASKEYEDLSKPNDT